MTAHSLDTALALSIDQQVVDINGRLKAARLGLKVERRGKKLGLRGLLPPKPDSPKLQSYQQRIPLGLPADEDGLRQVVKTVKVVAAELITDTFDWYDYVSVTASLKRAEAGLASRLRPLRCIFLS